MTSNQSVLDKHQEKRILYFVWNNPERTMEYTVPEAELDLRVECIKIGKVIANISSKNSSNINQSISMNTAYSSKDIINNRSTVLIVTLVGLQIQ